MIVRCRADGLVIEVLRSPLGLNGRLLPGLPLAGIAAASSRPKMFNLLRKIVGSGAALGWELDIAFANGTFPLLFSGYNAHDCILIMGSAKSRLMTELYWDLAKMTNEDSDTGQNQLAKSSEATGRTNGLQISIEERLTLLRTELLRLQEELVRKNIDLEKQKIDKFQELGMAAHGLRNPATSILAASEYLLEDAGETLATEHVTLLRGVVQSSLSILRMIDNILDVSTIECGMLKVNLAPADLVSVVKQAVLVNQHEADRKGIRLDTAYESSALVVDLDSIKFGQVIDNLVNNAIKFSDRGGRVEIRVSTGGNVASVSVLDSGLGISADRIETLFQPFQSGRYVDGSSKPGSGLGLAISRRMVEAHGGTIQVNSKLGEGSAFTVTLPRAAHVFRKPPAKARPEQSRIARGA
jgi:signal transduction histidine kinase